MPRFGTAPEAQPCASASTSTDRNAPALFAITVKVPTAAGSNALLKLFQVMLPSDQGAVTRYVEIVAPLFRKSCQMENVAWVSVAPAGTPLRSNWSSALRGPPFADVPV